MQATEQQRPAPEQIGEVAELADIVKTLMDAAQEKNISVCLMLGGRTTSQQALWGFGDSLMGLVVQSFLSHKFMRSVILGAMGNILIMQAKGEQKDAEPEVNKIDDDGAREAAGQEG